LELIVLFRCQNAKGDVIILKERTYWMLSGAQKDISYSSVSPTRHEKKMCDVSKTLNQPLSRKRAENRHTSSGSLYISRQSTLGDGIGRAGLGSKFPIYVTVSTGKKQWQKLLSGFTGSKVGTLPAWLSSLPLCCC
jgi:hypothetical protein